MQPRDLFDEVIDAVWVRLGQVLGTDQHQFKKDFDAYCKLMASVEETVRARARAQEAQALRRAVRAWDNNMEAFLTAVYVDTATGGNMSGVAGGTR